MVVDAGPLSTFTNATVNQRIPISQYTGTQLAQVGTNGVSWSAFTWLSDNTLYITRARTSVSAQSAAWQDGSSPAQGGTAARMATIPPGALDELNLLVYPVSTPSAVVEEDTSDGNPNYTDGVSYHQALAGGYGGNFNGTFQGNPENTTSNNFTTTGLPNRSDFYKLTPTGGPSSVSGTWMGYFELSTNGTMTYVAYPTTTPVLNSINRSGTSTTINYKAGLYGTYTLRGTNSLTTGVALTNWPALTTLSSGDTATHTITDTTSDNVRFYTITVQ